MIHEITMLWTQSFTSIKADLCQEVKGGFAFRSFLNEHLCKESPRIRAMKRFLEGKVLLRYLLNE